MCFGRGASCLFLLMFHSIFGENSAENLMEILPFSESKHKGEVDGKIFASIRC